MVLQTTFRFGELEAILADINEIPSVQRTSFQSKLKDIQKQGLLNWEHLPRGKSAPYGLRELLLMAIAVELCQFGLSTSRAVRVMLEDEWPVWMSVMMASNAIQSRPEVFNPGPGNTGNPPDQPMWGFSSEWRDAAESDPLSMFLYFDPSALAPWADPESGPEGHDWASQTFFYAGSGIVAESISRWTTGPTRRVALINVTKLMFDIAAYLAGTDGLGLITEFATVAQNWVHRGDFDLDTWLERTGRGMASMIAARPDRETPWMPLEDLLDADDPLLSYIIPIKQQPPEGEPDYVKDRQRPDWIIRLPGQRELSIDNKVSPVADIPQRGIDWRLQELQEQPYRHQFSDNTEYVVLYIPSDDFLAGAIAADHTLFDRAFEQKVLLATPVIMLNLLGEVDQAWRKYHDEFPDLFEEEYKALLKDDRRAPPEEEKSAKAPAAPITMKPSRRAKHGDR